MFFVKSVGREKIKICDSFDFVTEEYTSSYLNKLLASSNINIEGAYKEDVFSMIYKFRKSKLADYYLSTSSLFKMYNKINRNPIINGEQISVSDIDAFQNYIRSECNLPKLDEKNSYIHSSLGNNFNYTSIVKIFPENNRLFDKFPINIYSATPEKSEKTTGVVLYLEYFWWGKNGVKCKQDSYSNVKLASFNLDIIDDDILYIEFIDGDNRLYKTIFTYRNNTLLLYKHELNISIANIDEKIDIYNSTNKWFTLLKDNIKSIDKDTIKLSSDKCISLKYHTLMTIDELESEPEVLINSEKGCDLIKKGVYYYIRYNNIYYDIVSYSGLRYYDNIVNLAKVVITKDEEIVLHIVLSNKSVVIFGLYENIVRRSKLYKITDDSRLQNILTNETLPITIDTLKDSFDTNINIDKIIDITDKKIIYADYKSGTIRQFNPEYDSTSILRSLYYVEYDENTDNDFNYVFVNEATGEVSNLDFDYLTKAKEDKLQVDGTIGLVMLGKSRIDKLEKSICSRYQENIIMYLLLHGMQVHDTKIKIDFPINKFILDDSLDIDIVRDSVMYEAYLTINSNGFELAKCPVSYSVKKGDMSYYIMNNELYIGFVDRSSVRYKNIGRSSELTILLYRIKDLQNGHSINSITAYESEFLNYKEIVESL